MHDKTKSGRPVIGNPSAFGRALDRRELMQGTAALGLAAAFHGTLGLSSAFAAYDPKKFAGTTINIIMPGDENDHRALADLLPAVRGRDGHEARDHLAGARTADREDDAEPHGGAIVVRDRQLSRLPHHPAGGRRLFRAAEPVHRQSRRDPAGLGFRRFHPAGDEECRHLRHGRRQGRRRAPTSMALPGYHSGSVIYFYRKDLFEAAGLQPAKTWEEFQAAAEKLHTDEVAGCSFIGANDFSLATVDWYTRFITIGGKLMTGDPQTKDFKPNVDSPEGDRRAADADRPAALRAGERHAVRLRRERRRLLDRQDRADDLLVDDRRPGLRRGEFAGRRQDRDRAGARRSGPDAARHPGRLGRSASRRTSTRRRRRRPGARSPGSPTRRRTATRSRNTRSTPTARPPSPIRSWSRSIPYLPDSLAAIENADTIPTSRVPEFFQLNDIMNVEFNKALIGGQDAKTACANVQAQWEEILRKAGHLA